MRLPDIPAPLLVKDWVFGLFVVNLVGLPVRSCPLCSSNRALRSGARSPHGLQGTPFFTVMGGPVEGPDQNTYPRAFCLNERYISHLQLHLSHTLTCARMAKPETGVGGAPSEWADGALKISAPAK
jgi:hypothetical protein